MLLNREIAQPVVNQIMKVFKFNINIMNENGVIIASGDPMRVKQLHHGALEVIKNNHTKTIYENELDRNEGVLPGVNLPILFQERIIGVVGITGHPQEVIKFGEVIKITVESLITQQHIERLVQHKQLLVNNWFNNLLSEKTSEKEAALKAEKLNINTSTQSIGIFIEFCDINNSSLSFYNIMNNFESNMNNFIFNYEINFFSKIEIGVYFISVKVLDRIPYGSFVEDIKKLQKHLSKTYGGNYIGISSKVDDFSNLTKAFHEANAICNILQILNPHTTVATIDELGITPIVYAALKNKDDLFLPPLYEKLNQLDAESLNTLHVFYDCNMQNNLAASRLHIHRNTLYYRIEKISEFLNVDIKNLNTVTIIIIYLHYKKLLNI